MTDVFLERTFDLPLEREDVLKMAIEGTDCFALYRVDWLGSLLATDGRRMVCWFRGPDAESARAALRQAGAELKMLWPGTVHHPQAAPEPDPAAAQVLVTRSFDEPVDMTSIQAFEDAGARCPDGRGVRLVRSFLARDRRRMVCLYRAPDVESARLAQRQAGMPVESVWACRYVHVAHESLPRG